MKSIFFLGAALSMVLIGFAAGQVTANNDQKSNEVFLPEFILSIEPTVTPTITVPTATITPESPTLIVEIVSDTPMPNFFPQAEPIIEVVLVNEQPIQEAVIEVPNTILQVDLSIQETVTEVPTLQTDYSEWIIPLYFTDEPPPVLDTPVVIQPTQAPIVPLNPISLDEAWDTAVEMGLDDRFPLCGYPLPMPFVDWSMALEASELQTADRQYTEIKITAADISRIMARGGGYFPAEVCCLNCEIYPREFSPPGTYQLR